MKLNSMQNPGPQSPGHGIPCSSASDSMAQAQAQAQAPRPAKEETITQTRSYPTAMNTSQQLRTIDGNLINLLALSSQNPNVFHSFGGFRPQRTSSGGVLTRQAATINPDGELRSRILLDATARGMMAMSGERATGLETSPAKVSLSRDDKNYTDFIKQSANTSATSGAMNPSYLKSRQVKDDTAKSDGPLKTRNDNALCGEGLKEEDKEDSSVGGTPSRKRRLAWARLLQTRPRSEDAESMSAWIEEVLMVSDMQNSTFLQQQGGGSTDDEEST